MDDRPQTIDHGPSSIVRRPLSIRLSVVIPNYNRADALQETLLSLARQTMDPALFEVVVVDDGSTDGSVELLDGMIAGLPFSVSVLQQPQAGPGAARNRGAAAAGSDLLLFWDSDMIAGPATLREHAALHGQHQGALVAGARRPWAAACTTTFARITVLSGPGPDHFGERQPTFVDVLSSNLSIPRHLFEQLGGFDESLRAYEDLDLAYRAQRAGVSLVFSHDAFGYHNHPQTMKQACEHQRAYQAHAAVLLQKYPEVEGAIRYLVDKGPVDWRRDSPSLVLRKAIRRVIASPAVLPGLVVCVHLLERWWPAPRLLAFFYWKVISSHQLLGYRAGLASLRTGQRK